MSPIERDAAHLWDMREAARETVELTAGLSEEEFLESRTLRRATERTVEIIGEAARRVSSEFREAHPEIPWRNIVGLQNILAYEYGRIDHQALLHTARNDIPALIPLLDSLIGDV